jgi:hypothetical protein
VRHGYIIIINSRHVVRRMETYFPPLSVIKRSRKYTLLFTATLFLFSCFLDAGKNIVYAYIGISFFFFCFLLIPTELQCIKIFFLFLFFLFRLLSYIHNIVSCCTRTYTSAHISCCPSVRRITFFKLLFYTCVACTEGKAKRNLIV